ncbi:MAG TPA: hypothetical protein V6C57_29300 [Coleofasciculaceae cyanobacterium]
MIQPNLQPSLSTLPTDRKAEAILVAVAEQLSKLVQLHQLTETAKTNLPEASVLDQADAIKQGAIANIFMLLTAYYQSQGWNPQEIKTLIANTLERYRHPQDEQRSSRGDL